MCIYYVQAIGAGREVPQTSITEFANHFQITSDDLRKQLGRDNKALWSQVDVKLDKVGAEVQELNVKFDRWMGDGRGGGGGEGGGAGPDAIKNEEAKHFWTDNFGQKFEVYNSIPMYPKFSTHSLNST